MLKRIILILVFSIFLILIFTSCQKNTRLLPGEMLLNNGIIPHSGKGVILYSPSSKRFKKILDDNHYGDIQFSKDKTKIYFVKTYQKPQIGDYAIFEYDLKYHKIKPLIKVKEKVDDRPTVYFNNLRNVPGANKISYIWNYKMYIYDLDTSQETFITKLSRYSWNNDGSNFLFNDESSNIIYKYDLKTQKKEKLFSGNSPEYSNNNEYIAYLKSAKSDILVLREIKTGKEWLYKDELISTYKFSPDDKYIAIKKLFDEAITPGVQTLEVWDFKNNVKSTLIKQFSSASYFDWRY